MMKKYLPTFFKYFSIICPRTAARIALSLFATPTRIPRPQSEKEWHRAAKKYFLSNGTATFEWGDPTHPLVLLIHGWNGRGTQLASFASPLVALNYRVVAVDGPGHGESPGKQTNLSAYAQFIIDAQNELIGLNNSSQAIIAHSFGGGSSVLALSKGLKTRGIVLIASPAYYERVVSFFVRAMQLSKKSEEIFFLMVTKITGMHPRELNIGLIGSKLHLPALIIHDEDDTAVDYLSAKAIHTVWPASRLITTQGLGHRRILKDKNIISEVTAFIKNLSL